MWVTSSFFEDVVHLFLGLRRKNVKLNHAIIDISEEIEKIILEKIDRLDKFNSLSEFTCL